MSRPSSASSSSSGSSTSTYTREAGRFRRSGMWNWSAMKQQRRPATSLSQGRNRQSPRTSGIRVASHANNTNNRTAPLLKRPQTSIGKAQLLQQSLGISRNEIPLFPEHAKEGTKEYLTEMMDDIVERDCVLSPFVDGERKRRLMRHRLRLAQKVARTQQDTTHQIKKNKDGTEVALEELDQIFLHRWHFGKPGSHYDQYHHHKRHPHHGRHHNGHHNGHHNEHNGHNGHHPENHGNHSILGTHETHETSMNRVHVVDQKVDQRHEERQTKAVTMHDSQLNGENIETSLQHVRHESTSNKQLVHQEHQEHHEHHEHHEQHHHHRHHHHHHNHSQHPDHGLLHPLHLSIHPYHKHRDPDHVTEWLDTNRNRSASPLFLRQNMVRFEEREKTTYIRIFCNIYI